jgi:hypothetical protein
MRPRCGVCGYNTQSRAGDRASAAHGLCCVPAPARTLASAAALQRLGWALPSMRLRRPRPWPRRLPESVTQDASRVVRAREQLLAAVGSAARREPSVEELAEAAGLKPRRVAEVLALTRTSAGAR